MIVFINPDILHQMHTDRYIEWGSMFLTSEFFMVVSILACVIFISRLKLDSLIQLAEHRLQKAVLLGSLCHR